MESSRCAPNTYGKATNRMVLHTGGDKKQAVYNLLSHPVAVRKPTETRQTEKVLHIGGVEKKAEHIPGTTESPRCSPNTDGKTRQTEKCCTLAAMSGSGRYINRGLDKHASHN